MTKNATDAQTKALINYVKPCSFLGKKKKNKNNIYLYINVNSFFVYYLLWRVY